MSTTQCVCQEELHFIQLLFPKSQITHGHTVGGGGGGDRGGNPGERGLRSVREARKERAGSGISKVAGSERKIERVLNIAYFNIL